MSRRDAIVALCALALCAGVARAWNTETEGDTLSWHAAYLGNDHAASLPFSGFTKNEHTELSHIALTGIGAGCFGIAPSEGGGCGTVVVDLNSAIYRPELLGMQPPGLEARGDDPTTRIEERYVPPPAQFSGLPDYGYGVYDWINKNFYCPALPADEPTAAVCHDFLGWMGLLNANHFGTQARNTYDRYHRIALALAARARDLRELLAEHSPADSAYAAFVREAELEALIFEGVGQHFFGDRWSIGHQWERWNAADDPHRADIGSSALAALVAGLLHGSQGITALPDAMCSPVLISGPLGNEAHPVTWRLGGLAPEPGVGDYRLADMFDGFFGLEFGVGDLPIDVHAQREQMLACLESGWAEVIRAFGEVESGVYGAHRIALDADPSAPDVLDNPRCWDAWATNAAMIAGWVEHPALVDIDKQARGQIVITSAIGKAREEAYWLVEPSWRVAAASIFADPNDVTLARGDIGPLQNAQTGDAYATEASGAPVVAEYVEPVDLDTLPERSLVYDPASHRIPGLDKHALFGFFNRAHADYWCDGIADVLADLRGPRGNAEEEACIYLADRVYRGTDPSYRGAQRERRHVDATPVEPICSLYGVTTDGVDESLPYYLHPGYVQAAELHGPLGYESVAAWCRQVPVIDTLTPCDAATADGSDDWDVVARVGTEGGLVTLRGHDFGAAGGTVLVGPADSAALTQELAVVSWNDTEIEVSIESGQLSEGQWLVEIRPVGVQERWSVGRFILRVGEGQCLPASLVGSWNLRRINLPSERYNFFFLADGSVMRPFAGGRPVWVKIGTWSVAGDTLHVEHCVQPNFEAFDLDAMWTPDAAADDFGVRSCPPSFEGPCPAMRGTYTYRSSDGTPLQPFDVDSANGYVSGAQWDEIYGPGWQSCHGACGEYWSTPTVSPCGPA